MNSHRSNSAHIDVLILDWHGGIRGKRLPVSHKSKLADGNVRLPLSTQTVDIWSDDCDAITGLGLTSGDPDGICAPLLACDSFLNQPWSPGCEQILCSLHQLNGSPSDFDVRAILNRITEKLKHQDIYPVVAVELEFYLMDGKTRKTGIPKVPKQIGIAGKPSDLQLYDMRVLDRISDFLTQVHDYAHKLEVPVETTLAEIGPGQFEINLKHQSNPVQAADHAILFKQLVDHAAFNHGLMCSFMAKPYTEHSGSGQHVHISLLDSQGNNQFDAHGQEPLALKKAVATCLNHLQESLLIFAPHGNSYRRLQPESFAPVKCDWSYDHRGVAIRLPQTSGPAARFEHRVAGADANPYLILAILLGGLNLELASSQPTQLPPLMPGEESSGEPLLPDWMSAIEKFRESSWVKSILGERFCKHYATVKYHEALTFNRQVSNIDYACYLSQVQ